jgi:hypothetical protein
MLVREAGTCFKGKKRKYKTYDYRLHIQRGYNSDLDAEFSQEICLLVSTILFGQLYHLTSHTPAVPKCLLPGQIIMIEIVKIVIFILGRKRKTLINLHKF